MVLPFFRTNAIAIPFAVASCVLFGNGSAALAQRPVVPGTGHELVDVGDDFEDPSWGFTPNNPKSSEDIDDNQRAPMGRSTNMRWYEGVKRGHPDVVRRVAAPEGAISGSEWALMLKSRDTGIPGSPGNKMAQDDFVANVQYRLKRMIAVSEVPSVTTRVYLPPVAEWEPRSGPHFGFRLALETTAMIEQEIGPLKIKKKEKGDEVYWPGMFVEFESKTQSKKDHNYAYWRIRSNAKGADFRGPQITQTGWWTLGMTVTPDGMVHYYARPGVDDLTAEDYITSQFPYNYRAERFRTFFYNVCSADNGQQWSTTFIVDDPKVFVARGGQGTPVASRPGGNTTTR